MAKTIMMQGTSSHVGKSILTTALCRIFRQDGLAVAPFKAQNMALNSYVTIDGEEMGRAQVAQAEAAGLAPLVKMNPVLLKPTGNSCSQVILKGRPVGNMSAQEYHREYSLKAFSVIQECMAEMLEEFEAVVIEGAGSPAEVNLKATDVVNMRIAKLVQAPVLLIADIDRGGALASVVGTLELLDQDERDLVKGIVINKFRGDIELLRPALEFLEQKTGKPVVGVIPHLANLGIDDEDSVSLEEKKGRPEAELEIVVLRTPKISNFTDFDPLAEEQDVNLRYVKMGEAIGSPDLIILPGSKNTIEDLKALREHGYADEILTLAEKKGVPVIGICGGYQMRGRSIKDPLHTESDEDEIAGLGLLDIETVFAAEKVTRQVKAACNGNGFLGMTLAAKELSGYEIHMGRTECGSGVKNAFVVTRRANEEVLQNDGSVAANGLVLGTYIHGIFDNDEYRRSLLNALRARKDLPALEVGASSAARKQASYDRLAEVVRQNLNMELIYKMMEDQV